MLKVIKFSSVAVVAICALVLTQCAPYEEEGISLPGAPVTSIDWSFIDAVDSTGAVIGIDSNRIAVSADAVEGAFLHLWDFRQWHDVRSTYGHSVLPCRRRV